jgi:2-amino-4-hydroxy-6-hydroxymethyldihydropteridine diphosphokinase
MAEAFLGLGANLGDRPGQLRRGLRLLEERGLQIRAVSSFRQTDPVGGPAQPDYVNAAARIECACSPHSLLQTLLQVEVELGRRRSIANAPRTLDLDLLCFGQMRLEAAGLSLPHPRMLQRRFVLAPLAELVPRMLLEARSVSQHLAALD